MHVQSCCFAYSTYCRFDVLVVVAVVACENIRFSSLFAAEDGDDLKFEIFSSNLVFEEFVRKILKASPLTNPFLTAKSFLGPRRVTKGEMCVL